MLLVISRFIYSNCSHLFDYELTKPLENSFDLGLIPIIISSAFIAPVFEEIFFRDFLRFLNACSISQKCVFEELVFSFEPRIYNGISYYFRLLDFFSKNVFSQEYSTRAQILKNGFSKKWVFLSAFWERKLEKWLIIFARTYCTPVRNIQNKGVNFFFEKKVGARKKNDFSKFWKNDFFKKIFSNKNYSDNVSALFSAGTRPAGSI